MKGRGIKGEGMVNNLHINRLRPYQREVALAILDSVFGRKGLTFSVEIALLRVKIKSILSHDPENTKLIMQATNALARLIKTRYNITKEQKKGLKEAIGNVLRDVALPIGIGIGEAVTR